MVSPDPLDEQITALLRQFLAETVGRPDEQLSEETDLIADLMLDSLDLVALIAELEARFALTIPDSDVGVRRFGTVGAIRGYVRGALAGRTASAEAAGG